jgi:hypothetical protein
MATPRKSSVTNLLLIMAVAAIAIALVVFLWNNLGDAHPAAVRNAY